MEDKRVQYWNNDYVLYWKSRVEESNSADLSNSGIINGDVKTICDDVYINAINLLSVKHSDTVLELGCGFGRSLPYLSGLADHVCAVDISAEMISMAKNTYSSIRNLSFYVSAGENLPFEKKFDKAICFGVFDAMYQTETIYEINRVLNVGGSLLLTGKNDSYFEDDSLALAAEMGAREKGHPNFFTNVSYFEENMNEFGFEIVHKKYFLRRGDFVVGKFDTQRPKKFYEYMLVLRKIVDKKPSSEFCISDKFSKTWSRLERDI